VLVLVRHGGGERVPIPPEARRLMKEQGAVEEG
jgi:hypothetical protein